MANEAVIAPGYDAQSLEVKRRRALAKMLMESSAMPDGQMVSGHYVAPSALHGINSVLRTYLGAREDRKADEGEAELSKAQNAALVRILGGNDPDKAYSEGASDAALSPELRGQFMTQGFASRLSKQKAEAEAAQDAAKAELQERRDEAKAIQQQARDEARYENMDKRDQARFDQQLKMQMNQMGFQSELLDRRLAASAANGSSGPDPYFTTVNTDQGLMKFNARTGQIEALTADDRKLVNTKDDPVTRAAVAGATERAKEVGGAEGKVAGQQASSVARAPENLETLDRAEALLKESTGSGIGALADSVAGFAGESTKGAEAAEALKVEAAKLTMQVPRMEGPQSDRDTTLYKEAAGNLADSTKPRAVRQAALEQLRKLNKKYAGVNQTPKGSRAAADAILGGK